MDWKLTKNLTLTQKSPSTKSRWAFHAADTDTIMAVALIRRRRRRRRLEIQQSDSDIWPGKIVLNFIHILINAFYYPFNYFTLKCKSNHRETDTTTSCSKLRRQNDGTTPYLASAMKLAAPAPKIRSISDSASVLFANRPLILGRVSAYAFREA